MVNIGLLFAIIRDWISNFLWWFGKYGLSITTTHIYLVIISSKCFWQMRHCLTNILVSFMSKFLSNTFSAVSYYLGVKTSGDFNLALLPEFSCSFVPQFFKEVYYFPHSPFIFVITIFHKICVTKDGGRYLLFFHCLRIWFHENR